MSDCYNMLMFCRHRLKEGFHMTSAHNGVVTLAAQLTMEVP